MALFSERNNLKEKPIFQKDFLNEDTRNLLWNQVLFLKNNYLYDFEILAYEIWCDYFKKCLDDFPKRYNQYRDELPDFTFLKSIFLSAEYFIIYDLLELIATKFDSTNFTMICNKIFKNENCAYRFMENKIVEIISEEEIDTITKAANSNISNVEEHINKAIKHFADKQNPDYRNSIKESISAVEAICRNITKESTLDKALKKLENNGLVLNSQLKQGLEKIYHYTNGTEGIRHALMDDNDMCKCDAKFMLVLCSAFINYIKEKSNN